MGLRDSRHIGRIALHPANADIVFVAALGHLWGPNRERGLFKTVDGGSTWKNVLFVDNDTGAVDVAIEPGNSKVMYAATYQRRRRASGASTAVVPEARSTSPEMAAKRGRGS